LALLPPPQGFNGLLLVVSHDRAFMDNAVDRLLVLTGDAKVRLFDGCYSEYLEAREAEEQAAAAAGAAVATAAGQAQDRCVTHQPAGM
jgi:ATPase subunit of ABC transporter with duplicated ATPase domains